MRQVTLITWLAISKYCSSSSAILYSSRMYLSTLGMVGTKSEAMSGQCHRGDGRATRSLILRDCLANRIKSARAARKKLVRDDHHSLQLRCIRTLYDTPPPRCGAGRCLPAQRGTPMRRSSLKQEGALEDMLHCCQQLKSNQEEEEMNR